MHEPENVMLMNMCMIRDGGNVVVIDRKKPDWPGITFPCGHVEPGEPFTDAAIREAREETGLLIQSPALCGVTDWLDNGQRFVVFLYKTETFSGELQSSDEGCVRWERLDALSGLRLSSGMEEYLRVFLENDLSELYYRNTGSGWIGELK